MRGFPKERHSPHLDAQYAWAISPMASAQDALYCPSCFEGCCLCLWFSPQCRSIKTILTICKNNTSFFNSGVTDLKKCVLILYFSYYSHVPSPTSSCWQDCLAVFMLFTFTTHTSINAEKVWKPQRGLYKNCATRCFQTFSTFIFLLHSPLTRATFSCAKAYCAASGFYFLPFLLPPFLSILAQYFAPLALSSAVKALASASALASSSGEAYACL